METYKKLTPPRVHRADKEVSVTVWKETEEDEKDRLEVREPAETQALLVEIGFRMGMQIWVPRNDQTNVLARRKEITQHFLNGYPCIMLKQQ